MRHEDRPTTVSEAVRAAQFPVYGIIDHALALSICSHGLGISHLGNLMSISLTFTSSHRSINSPYSAESQNFTITSVDAATQQQEREQMTFDLRDPRASKFSKEEQKPIGDPLIWEGNFPIANDVFSGKILHWTHPFPTSAFLLKSERTILIGDGYGPSYKDAVQLLKDLQIINHQDSLLLQYQHDFGNQQ